MIRNVIQWMLENKAVTILSVLLFSFFVATIAVAVEKANKEDELNLCLKKLHDATTTTTTTAPPTEAPTTTEPNKNESHYRLPIEIVPSKYDIKLQPDLKNNTFEGVIDIFATVKVAANKIVLHSNNLEIDSLTLIKGTANIITTHKLFEDDREFLEITPDKTLEAGEYKITIKYNGRLDGIIGFYSSTVDGTKKIATSKFEPTYARQAFPCFDEPAMKAQFTVTLVRPKDYISLSNMNTVQTNMPVPDHPDLLQDKFEESVPMSTYLACFIICDFKNQSSNVNANGVGQNFTFSVYATEAQLEKVAVPMDIGVRVTEYYIDYFQLEYPLPKLDMIAIPDFVSGAMEHWGLVTFRETNLLYDKKTTSPANLQNIARVVAHEISHMWFGNLVTMNWWNELWLNEGFASYMQYKALDNVLEGWETVDQFTVANTHSVLALDATLSSHPIVQTVSTPDEITAIFDSISYNKGAAVLRMLENFVGESDFRLGVSNYLKKYKFKNTVTQDLWDELALLFGPKNPDRDLTYIMDTWTRQMGFPVINVAVKDTNTYVLTQKRFLADPQTKPDSPSQYNDRWYIPVTYKTEKNEIKTVWFPDKSESVELKVEAKNDLFKINNNQVGYYRVNYSPEMWDAFIEKLETADPKLTNSDKAHLLNDVFSLAEASEVSFNTALNISLYLKNETDYVPWAVGSSVFFSLKRILSSSMGFLDFKIYVRSLLQVPYTFVGWAPSDVNEVHVKSLLRSTILSLACSFGLEDCLTQVKSKFNDWLTNKTEIDANIKDVVYQYGIETNDENEWLKLWEIYKNETDAQEKSKLMKALASSRDPVILQRYLNMAWEESNVRSQDYFSVMQYISSNPVGTSIVWDYFRENWDLLVKRFTLNNRVLGTTVPAITRSFSTEYKLQEMEAFFAKNPEAGAGAAAREQAKENVKINIKWLKTHEQTVKAWLENQINS